MNRSAPLYVGMLMMLALGPSVLAAPRSGPESPVPAASQSQALSLKERFHKNPETGVISDLQTGFRWREGPSRPTSWNSAEAWVKALGQGWRLPTCKELGTLFVKSHRGRKGGACRNMPCEFTIPEEVTLIWAKRRSLNSAWQVSFLNGGDCWEQDNLSFAHGCRAMAISTDKGIAEEINGMKGEISNGTAKEGKLQVESDNVDSAKK